MRQNIRAACASVSYFAFTQVRFAGRYERTFTGTRADPAGRLGTH